MIYVVCFFALPILVATRLFFFLSILLTAISMAAGLAHLFELPNKIHLSREDYLIVQQLYRGWALLGIAVVGALLSTVILGILTRGDRRLFYHALIAVVCIVLSLIVFFLFTYPVNQQTANWTNLPADWRGLRLRWEYSHAMGAVLYLIAFIVLLHSALWDGRKHSE